MLQLSSRWRALAVAIIVLAVVTATVGWMVQQNRAYDRASLQAFDGYQASHPPMGTGLAEKDAVRAKKLPGVATGAGIDLVLAEYLAEAVRRDAEALGETEAPLLWRAHARASSEYMDSLADLFALRVERAEYVVRALGESPSPERVLEIHNSEELADHAAAIGVARTKVDRAGRHALDARPLPAAWLSDEFATSLPTFDRQMEFRSLDRAVECAKRPDGGDALAEECRRLYTYVPDGSAPGGLLLE